MRKSLKKGELKMKLRIFMASFLIVCILSTGIAFSEDQTPPVQSGPSTGAIVGDLCMRPFAAIGAIASTGIGFATMPIAFMMGVGEQWANITIEAPWRFAAERPLGEFNTYYDGQPITTLHR